MPSTQRRQQVLKQLKRVENELAGINRLHNPPKPDYEGVLQLLRDKATLAQCEDDIGDIFMNVNQLRDAVIEWKEAGDEKAN